LRTDQVDDGTFQAPALEVLDEMHDPHRSAPFIATPRS
jgi:hypothetical protein